VSVPEAAARPGLHPPPRTVSLPKATSTGTRRARLLPLAFSPVCTDQFTLYQEVLDDLRAQGADLYGVSCDSTYRAARLASSSASRSDALGFPPKGEATRLGRLRASRTVPRAGDRDHRPTARCEMRWVGEHPGVLPGANVIFDGLPGRPPARSRDMSGLARAAPAAGPTTTSEVPSGPAWRALRDYECPFCAVAVARWPSSTRGSCSATFRSARPSTRAGRRPRAQAAGSRAPSGRCTTRSPDQGRLETRTCGSARAARLDLARFDVDRRSTPSRPRRRAVPAACGPASPHADSLPGGETTGRRECGSALAARLRRV